MPPSRSFQAALPFCRAFSQLSRFLPSNKTRAPSGGVTLLTSTLSSGLANFRSPMSPYGSSARLAAEKMRRTFKDRIENRMGGLHFLAVKSGCGAGALGAMKDRQEFYTPYSIGLGAGGPGGKLTVKETLPQRVGHFAKLAGRWQSTPRS